MNDPEFVLTNSEELDIPPIDMYSINIGRANKLWALSRILSNANDEDQIIVFCNTKRMVDLSVQKLSKAGLEVNGLHGDLSQNQRERILQSYKDGQIKPSLRQMLQQEVLMLTELLTWLTTIYLMTWIVSSIGLVEQAE